MKKIFLLSAFLLVLCCAYAVDVTTHTIKVNVDSRGYAHIIETYQLGFESHFDFEDFKAEAEKNSSSMLAWRADFNWFYPRFAETTGNSIEKSVITFDEINGTVTLDYMLTDRFATLINDKPRETLWMIDDMQLSSFQRGGLIAVPLNTIILITIPQEAELDKDKISSKANVAGNTIVLNGISTNYINIQYGISKPITSPVGPFELTENLFGKGSNTILLIFSVMLLAVVVWKRKLIAAKIEDYIVEHSKIESGEEEKELEIEI